MAVKIVKVCSSEEARRIDFEASEKYGIDPILLMEDAGNAIFTVATKEFGLNSRVAVVAGVGNNGGDALVAARKLSSAGVSVRVVVVGDTEKYPEPARRNYEILLKTGVPVHHVKTREDLQVLESVLDWCDAAVVGLIGLGLKGEVKGLYREVIDVINKKGKPVVSVDLPSGIDADNGKVRGVAVKSRYTVSFGLPKLGNLLYPGFHYCGKLYVSHLSYPPALLNSEEIKVELNSPTPPPERVKWGHKGTFGKFLAIAGSRYYYGAPYYVAYAFLKAGGGYSRLAAPASTIPFIAARCSQVVYIPLEETTDGTIAHRNLELLLNLVKDYGIDIVAVGPGTSLNEETQQLVTDLVDELEMPIIIDGDGITAVAKRPEILKTRKAPTIITPHLVEFSRLTGSSTDDIQEDPVGSLRRACEYFNSFIVLKGAHTLVGYPDGTVYVNLTGNPGMAKAGTGDVLTGTIAAMYGIGYRDAGLAARVGVFVHGLAGDLAAESIGEDGVTPDDILAYLPVAVRLLREKPDSVVEKYFPDVV
ncbi:MAG: NAD(P)H-hydrate dehydratase [Thermofilaceae archaeon]|nr:NAD(P)H-hydrate dehydratase [Thermofilaceae archaeon]